MDLNTDEKESEKNVGLGKKSVWKGVEKPRKNAWGYDPMPSKTAYKKFVVRVRENNPFAKKSRRTHRRRIH